MIAACAERKRFPNRRAPSAHVPQRYARSWGSMAPRLGAFQILTETTSDPADLHAVASEREQS